MRKQEFIGAYLEVFQSFKEFALLRMRTTVYNGILQLDNFSSVNYTFTPYLV